MVFNTRDIRLVPKEKKKSAKYVTRCPGGEMSSEPMKYSLRNPTTCVPLGALQMHEHGFVLSGVHESS